MDCYGGQPKFQGFANVYVEGYRRVKVVLSLSKSVVCEHGGIENRFIYWGKLKHQEVCEPLDRKDFFQQLGVFYTPDSEVFLLVNRSNLIPWSNVVFEIGVSVQFGSYKQFLQQLINGSLDIHAAGDTHHFLAYEDIGQHLVIVDKNYSKLLYVGEQAKDVIKSIDDFLASVV